MEKESTGVSILSKLNSLERLLKRKDDTPFNFVQAAQYLSISHSQLYKLTSNRKIPFHKPCGKYLYFFKSELDLWIVNKEEDGKEEVEEEEPP